ncbi:hypothetical protein LRH25_18120 [Ideonella azotifigens]|uniref:Sulfotransferase family protein n=1 Tax=Ideonella azotifigens TaxID=513160 RepID=A0ABN1K7A1_9BURK|nr:hypothetical protein [Ideonella azotifigens]MCD2342257.1 hypothetical protein [Ideonella azotifigens]
MPANDLRVVQLGSMARSGETLFLRTFSVHPQVQVVHDLRVGNTAAETALFKLLRIWPANRMPRVEVERLLGPALKASATHLLLKQGVFHPRHAWRGVSLVRNPYAMFVSLWTYDAGKHANDQQHLRNWRTLRLPRLLAWCDAMDPVLSRQLAAMSDPLEQFLLFYAMRAQQLKASGRPLLHYEDLVNQTLPTLRSACQGLGLTPHDDLLRAHQFYARGEAGHGGMDLGSPIRPGSDWQPYPGLPTAPFDALVRQLGLQRYIGLYEAAAQAA